MSTPVMMEWRYREENLELAGSISNKLEIDPLLARILVARGIDSAEKAYDLLHPNLRQMHDPFLFDDMRRSVDRIVDACDREERIVVHGDYDVDGISSTALLFSFLKASYPDLNVQTFLPSRFDEGYGISPKCVSDEIAKGTELMITVDCGIKADREVENAMNGGMDVIITDHHEPGEKMPSAYSIIDPKLEGSSYPFRELAGVGVSLKVAHALSLSTDSNSDIREFMDLAALGTIADMVPLIDENRSICHFGLDSIAKTSRNGLRALIIESGIDISRGLTSSDVGFKLGPRLNSAGRLGHPDLALDLLLTQDKVDSDLFARELTTLNYKRQSIGRKLVEDILNEIDSKNMSNDPAIVVSGDEWNPGVIGISASRIMDSLGKPVIILTKEGEISRGSGRAPKGFDLVDALTGMKDLFIEFGGHERAAGMTMRTDRIDELRDRLNDHVETTYPDHVFIPSIEIDVDVTPDELDITSVEELQKLGPFGIDNPMVTVSLRDVRIGRGIRTVGSGKHMKFSIEGEGFIIPCIWFGSGDLSDEVHEGLEVDISGHPDIHHWRGDTSVQLRVTDLHYPVK